MSNGYLTGCALVISSLITFMFLIKKGIPNIETKIFKKMLIINILESLSTTTIVINALSLNSNLLFKLLNRVDVILIVTWCSLMFYYIYIITKESKNEIIKKIIISINGVIYVLALFLSVTIINENGILDSTGPLTFLGLIGALFYIVLMIVTLLSKRNKNYNQDKKKYIPLYFLIVLLIVIALLRMVISKVNFISILLSIVDMIMMFTVENPDLKMLRQMELARDQAERANRAKSDFLSSMSHEIRTPLNAIVGLSEDIASYENQVPKEVVEDTEDIRNASQTLLEIIGNILDINKIEADKMEIVEKPYNFKEEITNMCKVTQTRIGEKDVIFNLYIADDIPYELIGDKSKVKEVINNLLTNAIKYTEKGTINLNIKCINDINKNLSNLIITCHDTGRGIKAEYISKLFIKFERLDIEKNTTAEGTGLGLAITKALVEMMGGKINVQSQFGQGSIFMVQLPQRISKISKPMTEQELSDTAKNYLFNNNQQVQSTVVPNNVMKNNQVSDKPYGDKKVLIVDDNKLNIKVARRALNDFNFILDEVEDGQKCLDKIVIGNEYDLILMDIMMPNMSGETAFAKLKENPNFNIPTIALTADALVGAREKYLSEGFADYIAKPFKKDEIKERLDIIFKENKNTI